MTPLALVLLVSGLAVGALIGWLAGRPAYARLQSERLGEHALHAERLKAYDEAEGRFREAFASLSAQALSRNNEAFLHLAEARLGQARTDTTTDIDARKKAIEDLLQPMTRAL